MRVKKKKTAVLVGYKEKKCATQKKAHTHTTTTKKECVLLEIYRRALKAIPIIGDGLVSTKKASKQASHKCLCACVRVSVYLCMSVCRDEGTAGTTGEQYCDS